MVKFNSQGKQSTAIFIVRFSKDTVEEVVNSADVSGRALFHSSLSLPRTTLIVSGKCRECIARLSLDCDLFQFKNTFMQQADTSRSRIPG